MWPSNPGPEKVTVVLTGRVRLADLVAQKTHDVVCRSLSQSDDKMQVIEKVREDSAFVINAPKVLRNAERNPLPSEGEEIEMPSTG